LCCGSLEVAATAMFKTLCGLSIPGLQVDPAEFAEQWEHLVAEVLDDGRRDQWQLSHPFPPLRMRALIAFHTLGPGSAADAEVRRLLSLMEPSSAQGKDADDPYLARFLFWGGLYVALADGAVSAAERACLDDLAPAGVDIQAVLRGGAAAADLSLERFREARSTRRQKLNAGELHRMATGLIHMAKKGGRVSEGKLFRLRKLGEELGIAPSAVDMMMTR
jgi:uncharacterized tellurite resistance protein B-like protein